MKAFCLKPFLFFIFAAVAFTPLADSHAAKAKKSHTRPVATSTVNRHAVYAIDATSGAVLYQENANAQRHPASLTKMMTLYLTFEALKQNRLSLDQYLTVSQKAASMPKTNINLRPGDRISVRDAILSLVVNSANDSAVVLAEALGKTEWNFGVMMTNKARQLGMKNTVFRNASGLPDNKQYTTARDMALLGIALRRNFPDYYPYFKVQQFSFRGKTYTGHNRVIGRFDGVDGIKTGYINKSGYNLVSSAKQGDHIIVATVMGGRTAQARDDEMVNLLERSFAQVEGKSYYASRKPTSVQYDVAANDIPSAAEEEAIGDTAPDEKITSAEDETMATPLVKTSPAVKKNWGIQVGVFSEEKKAADAASKAKQAAQTELSDAKVVIGGTGIHRARLMELSEPQAKDACKRLIRAGNACFAFASAG